MAVVRNLLIKLGVDVGDYDRNLKKAAKDLKSFGKTAQEVGGFATKYVTMPLVAAGTGIVKMAMDAGTAADELLTMSAKTGIAVGQLQELQYASRFVDVELETMTGTMVKLTRSMATARDGGKDAQLAFKLLGVTYKKSVTGELLDSKSVWLKTIDALGQVRNETERDALAMTLFGKSAQELNPLIKAGSTQLRSLADEAQRSGNILSDDMVKAAGEFDDKMQRMQASLKSTTLRIGADFIPVIEKGLPVIERLADSVGDAVDKFLELDPEVQNAILGATAAAAAFGPLATAIGSVSIAMSTLMASGGLAGMGKLAKYAPYVGVAAAGIGASYGASKQWEKQYGQSIQGSTQTAGSIAGFSMSVPQKPSSIARSADAAGRTAVYKDKLNGEGNAYSRSLAKASSVYENIMAGVDAAQAKMLRLEAAQTSGTSKMSSGVDDLAAAYDRLGESIKGQTNSFKDFAGLFDVFERKLSTPNSLLRRLESQVKAMSQWQGAMASLEKRGVSGSLLGELRGMGPSAVDDIMSLSKMSDSQLSKYQGLYGQKSQIAAVESARMYAGTSIAQQVNMQVHAGVLVGNGGMDQLVNMIVKELKRQGVKPK